MKAFWKYLCFFGLMTLFFTVSAEAASSYGDLAKGAMGPVQGITKLLRIICLLTGVGLFFTGCVKISDWRRNPVETTIGLVLALLLAGLSLIALGLLPEMYRWVK